MVAAGHTAHNVESKSKSKNKSRDEGERERERLEQHRSTKTQRASIDTEAPKQGERTTQHSIILVHLK